ncbi:site-specific integrase [Sphingopyxis sp. JAI108]|uniref:tyrosine-type recombinase/integrase n=1 Tax=Sphingopyxis sp. JAI108 TaxID=2723060 RepID=UPI0015C7EA3C|nr:site-specific integrase [Sphingopyxis sp. JAI108]NYF30740.1 integrase [Sphingopyxis sp. JAI108]
MAGLTARFVQTAKQGRHCDGKGLYLLVGRTGCRSWILRVQVRGKRRDIGLGGVLSTTFGMPSKVGDDVPLEGRTHLTLAEARELSIRLRNAAKAGKDPVAELKRDRKLAPTFKEAVTTTHSAQSHGWGDKEAKAFLSSLENHAYASLGNKRVDAITADDVATALEPIWQAKPATAKKVRRRICVVLDYASAKGWRANAAPREQVRALTGKAKKGGNFPAMPYEDLPAYWTQLTSARETIGRLALLFLIATGARSVEVREAKWRHVDIERASWGRPAELMRKSDQAHVVTLNEPALLVLTKIALLKPEKGPDDFIFANRKGGMISDMTISKIMRDEELPYVPHGFRTSLRTWAAEKQPFIPEPAAESALSHVIPDAVIKAYNRAKFLEMRRKLLDQWGAYLTGGQWSAILPENLVAQAA